MIKFPIVAVIGAIDRFTAPLTKMQQKVNKTFGPLAQIGGKLRLAGETAGVYRVAEAFHGVGTAIGGVLRTVGYFSAAVGGVAVAAAGALYKIALGTARSGNEAAKAARKIGMTVEAYQELAYAAKLADVENTTLEKSLQIMVRTMGQAAMGSKKAGEGFRRLGINVRNAEGKLRPAEEVFAEVADRLNQLDDPLKRNAISALVFGRGAADLTNLLLEGSDGLKRYAAEARRLGVVLDGSATSASEDFMDGLERIQSALQGVRNTIGVALLPVLTRLTEKLVNFLVAHRGEIAAWAERFAAGLPEKLKYLGEKFDELVEDLRPVVTWVKDMIDRFGVAKVTATALGGALALVLVPSIVSTIAALATLSTALVSTPAGWVVLAVAALVLEITALIAIIYVWRDTWIALWGAVKLYVEFWVAVVKTRFFHFIDSIKSRFLGFFEWIAEKFSKVTDLVPDWLKGSLGISVAATSAAPAGAPAAAGMARASVGAAGPAGRASVKVEFANVPKGVRVSETKNQGADLDLSLGYSMLGGY